jgi:hypothetical protein
MNLQHTPQRSGIGAFLRSPSGLVLIAFLAIATFYLVTEHTAHFFGLLPLKGFHLTNGGLPDALNCLTDACQTFRSANIFPPHWNAGEVAALGDRSGG